VTNPKGLPVITARRHDGKKIRVTIEMRNKTPDRSGFIGFKQAKPGVQIRGASISPASENENIEIGVIIDDRISMPRKKWTQYIRTAIAHELAHAVDPQREREAKPAPRHAAPWIAQRQEYMNQPTEVRSHLTQMARDLRDNDARESVSEHTDPLAWARENAPDFAEREEFLDPSNARKFHQSIAAIWTAHKEGTLPAFEKSRKDYGEEEAAHKSNGVFGTLGIGDLKLIKSALAKALFIGPRGGKWKDAAHTIPYDDKPKKPRRKAKPKKKKGRRYPWGEAKWTEEQFAVGDFDKDPAHWQWFHQPGRAPLGGKEGGTQFDSQHPVKYGGKEGALYQLAGAGSEPGWYRLRDVKTGEERDVREDRVFPVFHSLTKRTGSKPSARGAVQRRKGAQSPPEGWDPTQPLPAPAGATGTSGGAERIPRFVESGATEGTALHKMENGYFVRHTRVEYEHDEGGVEHRKEVQRNAVDNHTKTQLLAEFEGMIVNTAKDVKKRFRLKTVKVEEAGQKPRDSTMEDLRMSAMEGLLVAVERYPGGRPFAGYAQLYAREYARIYGAKLMSDVGSLPKRVSRLIPKYLAAKADAAHQLGIDEPTPEQVVHFWDVKKRDLHQLDKDDPQRNEQLPARTYQLAQKERDTTEEGKRTKTTVATDVREHAGKREWAERIHKFLTGQATAQGSDFFEGGNEVFPGVHIGVGISEREKIEIRASTQKALEGLDKHEITISTGRQSSTYRADTREMILRELGLTATGEKQSRKEMAADITIEKRTKDAAGGEPAQWRPLGQRQKESMIAEFLTRGFDVMKKRMGGELGEGFISRAAEAVTPTARAKSGPTWGQRVHAAARKVSVDAVQAWRKKERDRLRRVRSGLKSRAEKMPHGPEREHQLDLANGVDGALRRIDRISNREIKFKIAQHELSTGPMSAEMRALMTHSVAVDAHTPGGVERGSATVTLTDPRTGIRRRAKIATIQDLRPDSREGGSLFKARSVTDTVTTGLLWDMMHRPRLTALLMDEDSVPSLDRAKVEALAGLH